MTTITHDNVARAISDWKKSAGSLRGKAQAIIEYGFDKYRVHGDAGTLTRMVVAAMETKGVNAVRMQRYIVAHTNLKWNERGNGFTKAKKGAPVEFITPVCDWYEFEAAKKETAPKNFNLNLKLNNLIDGMVKAGEEGRKIDLDLQELHASMARLARLIRTLNAPAAIENPADMELYAELRRVA